MSPRRLSKDSSKNNRIGMKVIQLQINGTFNYTYILDCYENDDLIIIPRWCGGCWIEQEEINGNILDFWSRCSMIEWGEPYNIILPEGKYSMVGLIEQRDSNKNIDKEILDLFNENCDTLILIKKEI